MTPGGPYGTLARLLTEAADVVSALNDVSIYCPFATPAEFAAHLRALQARVAVADHSVLRELVPIFAPTGSWDDEIGQSGMALANRIMGLLTELNWNA